MKKKRDELKKELIHFKYRLCYFLNKIENSNKHYKSNGVFDNQLDIYECAVYEYKNKIKSKREDLIEDKKLNKHVVFVSGGAASYVVLKMVIKKYGKENVEAVFSDTNGEDPDLYRFLNDIEKHLKLKITRIKNPKYQTENPWTLGQTNGRISTYFNSDCSIKLKQQPLNKYIRNTYGLRNQHLTLHFGMSYDEKRRFESLYKKYQKRYNVEFILADPSNQWIRKKDMIKEIIKDKIEVPNQYKLGARFNNCRGACVKQGKDAWHLLYKKDRSHWNYVKEQEQKHRKKLLSRTDLSPEQKNKRHEFCLFIRARHPDLKMMVTMDIWEKYFKTTELNVLGEFETCESGCGII